MKTSKQVTVLHNFEYLLVFKLKPAYPLFKNEQNLNHISFLISIKSNFIDFKSYISVLDMNQIKKWIHRNDMKTRSNNNKFSKTKKINQI